MLTTDDIINELKNYDGVPLTLMEICGTHTACISEAGIPSLLSKNIRLISGPGCPVCVTVSEYIDKLIELSHGENTTVVSFGDMLRVPGSKGSLKDAMADGGSVKMVYSPFEILKMARENSTETFVFAAVGFETTTPIYSVLLDEITQNDIKNIKFLTALKTMPQAIEFLCETDSNITGFLAPGHVAVITGANAFLPYAQKYKMPFVVSGFKANELLASIYALTKLQGRGVVKNLYKCAVTDEGNTKAQESVLKYFEPCDAVWRGIGVLKNSGMALKEEYKQFDLGSREITKDVKINPACSCGEVIIGKKSPTMCPLFRKVCTPENPQGSCMVSTEGSCYSYFINNRT